ncbi:MAG: ABC transporter substrate-binding protein [Rhodospirillales bacterium]|nr:ABC transporter substrate-binding protein [Rhodospirillales bacterium]
MKSGFAAAVAFALVLAPALSATAETPKRGGILNFAVTAEPPNYDCHASQTFALLHPVSPMFSYLVKYDSSQNGKIVGDLAKGWTVSDDGLTYTFKLHQGVKFHDGSPLTSTDVKASFDRIANPPTGVVSLRKSSFSIVKSIEAPDAETVVFRLAQPSASMLDNMASPFNCIYSAAKIKGDPKFPEQNILGSGAYQFVEYVRGSHLLTKRFDGYFRQGLPYLDGYKAFFVKTSAVVPGLLGGQFDAEFRGRTPSERDQLMNSPDKANWVLHEGPWATNNIVIFNTSKKPFDDPRVRRALSMAIDRWNGNEALSKITFVKATGGMLRPGYEYALPPAELEKIPGYYRDIEKSRAEARKLLKEAGVENLKIQLHNRTLAEPYTPVGVFLIDQWRRIGVTVEHSQVETSPYFANLVEGKFDVAFYPVTVPADEVTAQFQSYLTNKKSPISYSRHNDTKLDDLWDQQLRTLDPAKRKQIVNEFERHLLTQNYSITVNWWQRIIVHHKKVKGWYMSPSHFQGQDLIGVWLDQ